MNDMCAIQRDSNFNLNAISEKPFRANDCAGEKPKILSNVFFVPVYVHYLLYFQYNKPEILLFII